MCDRYQALDHVELRATRDAPTAASAGRPCGGHEFHSRQPDRDRRPVRLRRRARDRDRRRQRWPDRTPNARNVLSRPPQRGVRRVSRRTVIAMATAPLLTPYSPPSRWRSRSPSTSRSRNHPPESTRRAVRVGRRSVRPLVVAPRLVGVAVAVGLPDRCRGVCGRDRRSRLLRSSRLLRPPVLVAGTILFDRQPPNAAGDDRRVVGLTKRIRTRPGIGARARRQDATDLSPADLRARPSSAAENLAD